MPRKSRRPRVRRRAVRLLRCVADAFATGTVFFNQVSLEEVRELWEAYRESFLDYWVEGSEFLVSPGSEYGKRKGRQLWPYNPTRPVSPGTRPWVWWRFDAPEPRWRKVKATGELLPETGLVEVPGVYWLLESEAHYLRRLDLLRPGERQHLSDADFEPSEHFPVEYHRRPEADPGTSACRVW